MRKLPLLLKILHRFLFIITFSFFFIFFWKMNITNTIDPNVFFRSEFGMYISKLYMFFTVFNMYAFTFMIYDSIKRKLRKVEIVFWIIGSFVLPVVLIYIYFEKFIFKSYIFKKHHIAINEMKRNALIVYFLFWITIGFYMFYWFYFVMDFINQKLNIEKFKKDKIIIGLLLYQIIYVISFAIFYSSIQFDSIGQLSSESFTTFIFLWFFAFGYYVSIAYLIYSISRNILEIEKIYEIRSKISPGISVLLFILYFTTFPYIQNHINKVIDNDKPV